MNLEVEFQVLRFQVDAMKRDESRQKVQKEFDFLIKELKKTEQRIKEILIIEKIEKT